MVLAAIAVVQLRERNGDENLVGHSFQEAVGA